MQPLAALLRHRNRRRLFRQLRRNGLSLTQALALTQRYDRSDCLCVLLEFR